MHIQVRSILGSLALLALLAACRGGSSDRPQPSCPLSTPPSQASLCVLAVSVDLGPADEIQGYDPKSDLVVLVLPYPGPGPMEEAGDRTEPFTLAGDLQDLEAALTSLGVTDRKGAAFILTEPGDHLVCAVGNSLIEASRRVSRCEQKMLVRGEATPLLVSHSPWGDFLSFTWGDG